MYPLWQGSGMPQGYSVTLVQIRGSSLLDFFLCVRVCVCVMLKLKNSQVLWSKRDVYQTHMEAFQVTRGISGCSASKKRSTFEYGWEFPCSDLWSQKGRGLPVGICFDVPNPDKVGPEPSCKGSLELEPPKKWPYINGVPGWETPYIVVL